MSIGKFKEYDSADYLSDIESAAAYLEVTLDECGNNSDDIAKALRTIARSGSMTELARRTGMSREGLYKALSETGNPSFETILKVVRALGLRLRLEVAA